jgi:hypothetical protein
MTNWEGEPAKPNLNKKNSMKIKQINLNLDFIIIAFVGCDQSNLFVA